MAYTPEPVLLTSGEHLEQAIIAEITSYFPDLCDTGEAPVSEPRARCVAGAMLTQLVGDDGRIVVSRSRISQTLIAELIRNFSTGWPTLLSDEARFVADNILLRLTGDVFAPRPRPFLIRSP